MLHCSNCKSPIKYRNQLAYHWVTAGYACCVKCRRKNYRIIHAKKSVD